MDDLPDRIRLAENLADSNVEEERIREAVSLLKDLPPEKVAALFRWRASRGDMTAYRIVKIQS